MHRKADMILLLNNQTSQRLVCNTLQNFDTTSARNELEVEYLTSADTESKKLRQLSDYAQNNLQGLIDVALVQTGQPLYRRVCSVDQKGDMTELYLRIQGYIVQSSLPPFNLQSSFPKAVQYARQGVHLTGFGSEVFQRAVQSMEFLHSSIGDLMGKELRAFQRDEYREWDMVAVSNRLFTLQSKVPHEVLTDLPDTVDPKKHLLNAAKYGKKPVVHIDDNKVGYYRREEIANGQKKTTVMTACSPAVFNIGDLVEVKMSFAVYTTERGEAYKMVPILRAVALLSSQQRQISEELGRKHTQAVRYRIRKRTDGYESDEVERAEKRIGCLSLDDDLD